MKTEAGKTESPKRNIVKEIEAEAAAKVRSAAKRPNQRETAAGDPILIMMIFIHIYNFDDRSSSRSRTPSKERYKFPD